MSAVPFKVSVHAGLAEADGLLHLDADQLRVDFVIKDAVAGLLKSSHKVAIPLADVDDISFKQGWFGSKMLVRVLEIDLLHAIPWRQGAEFSVKIRNRDRHLATDLVEDFTWSDPPVGAAELKD